MNVDEFLTRYGGNIERTIGGDTGHRFTLTVSDRAYRTWSVQGCVDAALDDAMDYMAAGLQADREIEDVREERRAD